MSTTSNGSAYLAACEQRRRVLSNSRKVKAPSSMASMPTFNLPFGWTWASLSTVCERVSVGHVGPTTEHFDNSPDGVLFVRAQNVKPGIVNLDDCARITEYFHGELKKSQLRSGDILIVRVGANRGDVGVVSRTNQKINCANIVFARPLFDGRFFAFYLRSPAGRAGLLNLTTGSAQGVLNTEDVARLPVPVAPKPVMDRIASILGAYDDLIEVNRRRIAVLEEMARRLFEEWFVHFRFPGHPTGQGRSVRTVGLPPGWTTGELGNLLSLAYGKALVSTERVSGPVPVIGSSGVVGWHNAALVDRPGIVVGRKGNVGSVTWCPTPFFPIDTVFFVETEYPLPYLLHLLRTLPFQNSDAAVPGLNRSAALKLKVNVPPRSLCSEYERFVSPSLDLVDALRLINTKLTTSRDLLLPRLISGELCVAVAERELEDAA